MTRPARKYSTRLRILFTPLPAALPLLALGAGCSTPTELYEISLTGTLLQQDGSPVSGPVELQLYHASSGEGELAHPLELIELVSLETGEDFEHRLEYPVANGEGLVVYAWQDLDGDGVLCALGQDAEWAGLIEVSPFPSHEVSIELKLEHQCSSPEALYP